MNPSFRPYATRTLGVLALAVLIGRFAAVRFHAGPAPAAPYPKADAAEPGQPLIKEDPVLKAIELSDRGRHKESIESLSRAIAGSPTAMAYNGRGMARLRIGEKEGAAEDFAKAIDLDPGYADAYANRAALRREKGDLKGALADIDKVIELQPEAPGLLAFAHLERAQVHFDQKRLQDALRDVDSALKAAPKSWPGELQARGLREKISKLTEGTP